MKDERTTQLLQKIYSEMVLIIIMLCAASMLIKILYFQLSFNDCLLEWFIMVGSPVYRLIRTRMLKVSMITGPYDNKTILKDSAKSLIIVAALFGGMAIFRPETFTPKFILTFLVPYILLVVGIRFFFVKSEERHTRKLGEEYDD